MVLGRTVDSDFYDKWNPWFSFPLLKTSKPGCTFVVLHFTLTDNAMARDRPRFESFDTDIFATHLTNTISPVFDVIEGLANFFYQAAFPVPNSQGVITLGFKRGAIQQVGRITVLFQ